MCCVVRRVRERAYGLPSALTWQPDPLMDDQELDSRQSTGAVYWEGAARVSRDGTELGRAYLELTGYAGALRMGGP
jgi:Lipocalin-like domain